MILKKAGIITESKQHNNAINSHIPIGKAKKVKITVNIRPTLNCSFCLGLDPL